MSTAPISTRTLRGFDDPSFGAAEWRTLLAGGPTDVVFLSWQWQSAWWESFQRGKLLLIAAERSGEVVALAPFFSEAGMVYFVGSGGSDYLNFVGDIAEPEVLDALLIEARSQVQDFIGFLFFHVPDASGTADRLRLAAARLGMAVFDEGDQPAPALQLAGAEECALAAARKKLGRYERFFSRNGALEVQHLAVGEQIVPHLDEFFDQHCARWAATATPSLFCDEPQRQFYRNLTRAATPEGWLRFTRLDWNGSPIAFHFGFCYKGTYLLYKPAFAIQHARHSPGKIMLRELLMAALDEHAHTFDFGLGDEAYKSRFATSTGRVRNWGLYDPKMLAHHSSPVA